MISPLRLTFFIIMTVAGGIGIGVAINAAMGTLWLGVLAGAGLSAYTTHLLQKQARESNGEWDEDLELMSDTELNAEATKVELQMQPLNNRLRNIREEMELRVDERRGEV